MSIEVKCGSDLRDFILEKLYSSRRVTIFSPWISRETANILLDLSSRGIEVRLITTSDPLLYHIKGLSLLISVEKKIVKPGKPRLITIGLLLFIIGFLLVIPALFVGVVLVITGLFMMFKYRTIYVEHYYPRIRELLVTASRLHAKLIITDSVLGIGSMNFTESGLSGNIECFAWITDPRAREQVIKDINTIITTLQKTAVDYKSIYSTIKHVEKRRRK